MKVFESNGTLYGGYRIRKRDPITHKQHEQKVYSGRIVDGVYYTCLLYTSPSPRDEW